MALSVVMLGSGGWMPTPQRATSCLLARDGDDGATGALLLDAGTGIMHLARNPSLLGATSRLAVLISHFHLDHIAGLTYLPALTDRVEVEVWGPGRLLGGDATRSILGRLVGAPHLSVPLADIAARVEDLVEGDQEIGSFPVRCRHQERHPGGSVGFRIGDELTYVTDTAPDPATVDFAAGARALVHEAWFVEPTESPEHSSAAWAGEAAAKAGVESLVLSHVHPLHDEPEALAEAASADFPTAVVGADLLRVL
jgi:ribonuclease BN (tRNA processing enzyme)